MSKCVEPSCCGAFTPVSTRGRSKDLSNRDLLHIQSEKEETSEHMERLAESPLQRIWAPLNVKKIPSTAKRRRHERATPVKSRCGRYVALLKDSHRCRNGKCVLRDDRSVDLIMAGPNTQLCEILQKPPRLISQMPRDSKK